MRNQVITLNKDNLSIFMNEPFLLVIYVVEWCNMCKFLLPKLHKINPKWKIIVVDAERNFNAVKFYPKQIDFYPTIAHFENGVFMGEIKQNQIVKQEI